MRRAWYFLSNGKLADLINILHIPYTFMLLSFVSFGSLLAPRVKLEILYLALLAYFLGLQGSHALDQICPKGSHYISMLRKRDLWIMTIVGLGVAISIGIIGSIIVPYLWVLVITQSFFAISYPYSTLFKGRFHNNVSFAFAWGFLPPLIGYYSQVANISLVSMISATICFLIAYMEILLSRLSRRIRSSENPDGKFLNDVEKVLKAVAITAYLLPLLALKMKFL